MTIGSLFSGISNGGHMTKLTSRRHLRDTDEAAERRCHLHDAMIRAREAAEVLAIAMADVSTDAMSEAAMQSAAALLQDASEHIAAAGEMH